MRGFCRFVAVTLQLSLQCASYERAARLADLRGQRIDRLEKIVVQGYLQGFNTDILPHKYVSVFVMLSFDLYDDARVGMSAAIV